METTWATFAQRVREKIARDLADEEAAAERLRSNEARAAMLKGELARDWLLTQPPRRQDVAQASAAAK